MKLQEPDGINRDIAMWERRLSSFNGTSAVLLLIVLTIGLIYGLYNPDYFADTAQRIPPKINRFWFSAFVILIFIRMRVMRLNISFKRYLKSHPTVLLNFRRTQLILSVLMIGILVIPVIYLSGITEGMALLVERWIPALGRKLSELLTSILTWIISGIIGNIAFEKWKRLTTDYEKRKKYWKTK